MSTVLEIETAIARLSIQDMEAIRKRLDDLIEGQLEIKPDFKAKIACAKREIEQGIYSRVRQPDPGE
jgi:hypothetical protein